MSMPANEAPSVDGASKGFSSSSKRPVTDPSRDMCAIFVHAGAGYHSVQNEQIHLQACNDAAAMAMIVLRNGGSALDAVEMAVKVLEDREITNAGYGSNLAMDGVVECDASIVDHHGRSGAVGAVAQIKNPISLARCVLNHTMQSLTLRRVPPNLLVAQGATDFAFEQGFMILPHDALVSPAAKERWLRWKSDLRLAEKKAKKKGDPPSSYIIREQDPDADLEERTRERMRKEHANTMLAPYPSLTRVSTPSSGALSVELKDAGTSTEGSTVSSTLEDRVPTPATPSSVHSEHILESAAVTPPRLEEASRSAFVNSTQKVPLVGEMRVMRDVTSDYPHEDVEMTNGEDDSSTHPAGRISSRRSCGDGSSEDSDTSSGKTMIPPPPFAPAIGAANVPLPDTPQAKNVESPTPRFPSPLSHVHETAPLPPFGASKLPLHKNEDNITDTVGAIACDRYGKIACGASSGGIGMKYRGRVGPAALVGVGACVIPLEADDKEETQVATVTSGTGEHMATTMAATVCAERLYQSVQKVKGGAFEEVTEDEAVRSMIQNDFMGHPSVMHSNSAGAIGILGMKKTRWGIHLYFGHNTDSFAIASMHSDETRPICSMSRSNGNGSIAQGGRALRYQMKKQKTAITPNNP